MYWLIWKLTFVGDIKWDMDDIMTGRHRVEVVFGGRQIDGSPFYVDVFDLLSIRVDNFRQSGLGEPAGFDSK